MVLFTTSRMTKLMFVECIYLTLYKLLHNYCLLTFTVKFSLYSKRYGSLLGISTQPWALVEGDSFTFDFLRINDMSSIT